MPLVSNREEKTQGAGRAHQRPHLHLFIHVPVYPLTHWGTGPFPDTHI
jgi:hypothetical protein